MPLLTDTVRLVRRPFEVEAIAPHVYRLNTPGCRVFALVDGGVTLIDCGIHRNARLLLRQLARLGKHPHDVERVLLTHYHVDHIAGAPAMLAATGAELMIHEAEAPLVSSPEPYPVPFQESLMTRLASLGYNAFMPGPLPATPLRDGDVLPVLGGLRVIHTPGHTPGSASFLLEDEGILFTGDALQVLGGRVTGPHPRFTADMALALRSLARLADLELHTIVPAHFNPVRHQPAHLLRNLVAHAHTPVPA
jgi:glyoxylase-like metal-dependent hydrolase (beta-lactamase superfamily II)